jgi:dTDP-4-dehydrorhamnose reductase
MTARLLIFGANGQLGRALARTAWPLPVDLVLLDRAAADLSAAGTAAAALAEHRPALVINAAAYTAVDRAESEHGLAFAINAAAPAEMAAAAAAQGVPVVHVSTDYVFDGAKPTAYIETDPIAPLGVYGATKAAGEEGVRGANPRHLILRTSWVYADEGQNFVRTMLRLGSERDEMKVVNDQTGSPTSAADLAAAIARLTPALLSGNIPWGTYHLTGGGETTWHGFAEAIFQDMAQRRGRRPRLLPIPSSAYPTPARRPSNSRLDNSRFRETFGFALPQWQASLAAVLGSLNRGAA